MKKYKYNLIKAIDDIMAAFILFAVVATIFTGVVWFFTLLSRL